MRRVAVLGVGATCFVALYACVGDSPDTVVPTGDAGAGDAIANADGSGTADGSSPADGSDLDAGDAGQPRCDITAPFTSSAALTTITTIYDDVDMSLSPDELEILFETHAPPDGGPAVASHIRQATRGTTTAQFGNVASLDLMAPDSGDVDPWLQPDDETLYFASTRSGSYDVYVAKRTTSSGSFLAPSMVMNIDTMIDGSPAPVRHPTLNATGTEMFFATQGPDLIYRSVASGGVFGTPTPVMELDVLNGGKGISAPVLAHDGLALYFSVVDAVSSNRAVWVAQRADAKSPFGNAHALDEVNQYASQTAAWISSDNCRLYLSQRRDDASAQGDFYVYSKSP